MVALELDLLQFEDKQARFFARLEEAGPKSKVSGGASTVLSGPEAGAFIIKGNRFELAPGFRMVWKTAAPPKERVLSAEARPEASLPGL